MPYYQGDYYQGDNYQAGGLFGSIGKAIGGLAKTAFNLSPVGRVASTAVSLFQPKRQLPMIPVLPEPGITGLVHRIVPGGSTGLMVPGGGGYGHRRRMNVTNVKALRRAGRRVKGFLKLARRLGALPVSSHGKKIFKIHRKAKH